VLILAVMSIQIVLALENKPSQPLWLERIPTDVFKTEVIAGDHVLAYLRYVINNYDCLSDYVLFLRSDPLQFCTTTANSFIHALLKEQCLLFDKTFWLQSLKCLPDGRPHHPGLAIEDAYKKLFPGQQMPQVIEFIVGSQFMVTKQKVLGRPKEFYESLLALYNKGEVEAPVLERLWSTIFQI
jgi:hypothetical protein